MSAQAPVQTRRSVREPRASGDRVTRSRGLEWLARAGFAARGLIYGITGILAIGVAVGAGGTTTNQQGALKTIARQPFGHMLLILVACGLGGYALWRLVRALLVRVRCWITWVGSFGHLARMVVFGLVGVFLIRAAVDYDPNQAIGLDGALAKIANASCGPFLLGLVAAGLIAFGIYSLGDARYRRI